MQTKGSSNESDEEEGKAEMEIFKAFVLQARDTLWVGTGGPYATEISATLTVFSQDH